MIKKIYLLLISLFFYTQTAIAEVKIREVGESLYLEDMTVEETEEIFTKLGYTRFLSLKDNAYPAIFLKTLPTDFQEIKSQKYRNELFIRILAPLALKINEEILNERNTLLRLERNFTQEQSLSPEETQKLENLALKYDFFTRLSGKERIQALIFELKRRINIIPPSIFIAAAAMESNWGSSRVANVANSLYKEKLWYTTEGLEPLENKEDGYRFKIFDSLVEGMRSFALTFNSNIKFRTVWIAREQLMKRNKHAIGESLAYTLSTASELPNFAGILNYTTAFYDLLSIDIGHLKKGLHKNDL